MDIITKKIYNNQITSKNYDYEKMRWKNKYTNKLIRWKIY